MRWVLPLVATAAILRLDMTAAAEPVRLYAAGSLRAAFTEVARAFEKAGGPAVATTFGASGLLRQRIEGGERADVFASANMQHPTALTRAGRASPVALFARNRLCALAQPAVGLPSRDLLDALLDPDVRLGTSTPKADPSGDYAWALFRKAEAVRPGAFDALEAKALKLTGGPESPKAPAGRNQYAWVMDNDQADIFLTYCTNALRAQGEVPRLDIAQVPPELSVGADYGLTVLDGAPEGAWRLAVFILSPAGQSILAGHGFDASARPGDD